MSWVLPLTMLGFSSISMGISFLVERRKTLETPYLIWICESLMVTWCALRQFHLLCKSCLTSRLRNGGVGRHVHVSKPLVLVQKILCLKQF